MKQTGQVLKSTRKKQGISISEVSMATKISARVIERMEEGATDDMPPLTFLRGFVRTYATYLKLDADKNQKLVRKYKVMALPTLLFFKDGELVDRTSGVVSKTAILKKVKPLLSEEDQEAVKTGFNWRFWE